jgi:hypothetical protein
VNLCHTIVKINRPGDRKKSRLDHYTAHPLSSAFSFYLQYFSLVVPTLCGLGGVQLAEVRRRCTEYVVGNPVANESLPWRLVAA